MIKPYETINSFTRRPVISQIVAYLVFIGEVLTFFICMYVNFTSSTKQIVILVLYIVTAVIQVVVTLITSYIDPSDSVMIEFKNNAANRRNMDVQNCLFCDFCTSYVKQTSRHCKVCQRYILQQKKVFYYCIRRCVEKFDHHCMWINNCIGIKNYRVFIVMIISTFVNMLVYVIGMILLWTEGGWVKYIGPMVAIWSYSVIILIFSVLLFNLICLHLYLIYKGLTTYQFIMQQREEEKKKKNETAFQTVKNKKTSIEQEMSIKPSSSSEQASSSSQNSSSSLNKKITITSKRFQSQQSDFKSDGTSSIIVNENKNVLENKLRTEKSEESTYQAKKMQLKNNTIFVNSQEISQQKQEEIEEVEDDQNMENISSFFTKNKSLKFLIGTQVGERPKSAIISINLYQNHSVNVGGINNNNEIQTNKSMFTPGSKNLNNKAIIRKTTPSLKAVHPTQTN